MPTVVFLLARMPIGVFVSGVCTTVRSVIMYIKALILQAMFPKSSYSLAGQTSGPEIENRFVILRWSPPKAVVTPGLSTAE